MMIFADRYFEEISLDTGRYCFGVDDTLKALESGAVETLIVWENLDVTRYVLKNHSSDSEFISTFLYEPPSIVLTGFLGVYTYTIVSCSLHI